MYYTFIHVYMGHQRMRSGFIHVFDQPTTAQGKEKVNKKMSNCSIYNDALCKHILCNIVQTDLHVIVIIVENDYRQNGVANLYMEWQNDVTIIHVTYNIRFFTTDSITYHLWRHPFDWTHTSA